MKIGFQKKVTFKITTPEIICDLFSFLDKDMIERIQIVNQFWNNVIMRHKNILPLREFNCLKFEDDKIHLDLNNYGYIKIPMMKFYAIKFDGTNLSKIEEKVSSRYSQLTVDEVLTNLNDVVFNAIQIEYRALDLDNLLNMMKLVTTKTGGRFRGKFGYCETERIDSKLDEIFDNYIIVDILSLGFGHDSYIREVCANPEIVQLLSTLKETRLRYFKFKENEELLHFTCNGKLNRLTIELYMDSDDYEDYNYGNFIRQWFELYLTHQNPISLVGKFEINFFYGLGSDSVLDAVKRCLNNTQLHVKYSLEAEEVDSEFGYRDVKRSCVLHETDSYALVIEMDYFVTDRSSINASDLDQPEFYCQTISFCVKSM